jgi:hypothetical protein
VEVITATVLGIGDAEGGFILASNTSLSGARAVGLSLGDHVVGDVLQGRDDIGTTGTRVDGSGQPVLAEGIEEAKRPIAGLLLGLTVGEKGSAATDSGGGIGEESHVEDGVLDGGHVVEVEGIDTRLALAKTAIRAIVTLVALAAHGGVSVPELVDVAVVGVGELLDGLAHTVAGAGVGEARAGGTLAGDAIVAVIAGALTSGAVAGALVGAFHVIVRGVDDVIQVRILHLRKLLGGAVRISEVILDDWLIRARDRARVIQITLGSINVGKAELASTLTAIIRLPIAVANAHIVTSALSVATASVGALSISRAEEAR